MLPLSLHKISHLFKVRILLILFAQCFCHKIMLEITIQKFQILYTVHNFLCHSHVICMPFVCQSYVLVCHTYVIRMSLACTRMSSACHSYVPVSHPYVTLKYSYVIYMSLVCHSYVILMSLLCTHMSSVCHSYVILMSLLCTSMSSVCHWYVLVCHGYAACMWFYRDFNVVYF